MNANKILLSLFLFVGCASMRAATNVNVPPARPVDQAQAAAEQGRQRAVFQAVLSGMSDGSAAKAQLARDIALRPVQQAPAPTRFVCQPPAPYTGEVVCREQP